MMFTQRSILNRDSTDVGGRELNRTPFRQRTSVFGFKSDLHYLALSTDLKTVSCHLICSHA